MRTSVVQQSPGHAEVSAPLWLPRYKLQNDTAGWLSVDKDSGSVQVRRGMDRESRYITDGDYRVVVVAYDNSKG